MSKAAVERLSKMIGPNSRLISFRSIHVMVITEMKSLLQRRMTNKAIGESRRGISLQKTSKNLTHSLSWKNKKTLMSSFPSKALLSSSSFDELSNIFRLSPEIQQAQIDYGVGKAPIVALESAIITHGMPFPYNIETALRAQNIVRQQGAIPATIGCINGALVVGLSDNEIKFLGSKDPSTSRLKVIKISRRDIPFALSQGLSGGTTVSGTIIGAMKANISVFATGGIGGVHRGAEESYDVSTDLRELGRNPIAVVSSGVKSILDIGKTLEYMETEGICVCVLKEKNHTDQQRDRSDKNVNGLFDAVEKKIDDMESIRSVHNFEKYEEYPREYNIERFEKACSSEQNNVKFPSFFTSESAFNAPFVITSEKEAAGLIHSLNNFGLKSGILIAVPIPKEFQSSGEMIENAIMESLEKAKMFSIRGKAITPFLLEEINELTKGKSLEANKKLIENNAKIRHFTTHSGSKASAQKLPLPFKKKECVPDLKSRDFSKSPIDVLSRPVVIGGSTMDMVLSITEENVVMDGRTHSTKVTSTPGGVGRNVAEGLKKLGQNPLLISVIGNDFLGKGILRHHESFGMDCKGIEKVESENTASYLAVLNSRKECLFGLGDMDIFMKLKPSMTEKWKKEMQNASLVIADGNIPKETLTRVLEICSVYETPVWFEPTEVRKAMKISCLENEDISNCLRFISPNLKELLAITTGDLTLDSSSAELGDEVIHKAVDSCFRKFPSLCIILLTLGKRGFMVFRKDKENIIEKIEVKAGSLKPAEMQSVSGAGDCLNAGFIHGHLSNLSLVECADLAVSCANQSLLVTSNVPDTFITKGRSTTHNP